MMRILGYLFLLYVAVAAGADAPVLAGGVAGGVALWGVRAVRASRAHRASLVALLPPVVQLPAPPAPSPAGVYDLASYRERRAQ